jgi:CRP-like cAMP-binding protein
VLERLAAAAEEVAFTPGDVIVREGDPADAIYVLGEGEVEVTDVGAAGGEPRVLATLAAPAYFGEIGVLEGIPRTAAVTAREGCSALRIDGGELLVALRGTPASATLMEDARARLSLTRPSRPSTEEPVPAVL